MENDNSYEEDYTEIDFVFENINKLEKMIDDYFSFINFLWETEIVEFNDSADCNLIIDTHKFDSKSKFIDVMIDTPYYKQLLISQANFSKRLEVLEEMEKEKTSEVHFE